MHGYPIVLDVTALPVLVIGGGEVASRKITRLLAAGATVRVVSPRVSPEVAAWAEEGRLDWQPDTYQPEDLAGARLAIIATDDPAVNRRVAAEAERLGIWANVASEPDAGRVTLPAIAGQPPLRIAIDSGGGAPALARRLRHHLDATLDPGWAAAARLLGGLRPHVVAQASESARRAYWRALVATMPKAMHLPDESLVAHVATIGGRHGVTIAPMTVRALVVESRG